VGKTDLLVGRVLGGKDSALQIYAWTDCGTEKSGAEGNEHSRVVDLVLDRRRGGKG